MLVEYSVDGEIVKKRCFCANTVVIDGGRVLLVKHKSFGIWIFPGGHMDAREDPDVAALRECKEETGLDVELVDCGRLKFANERINSKPLPMLIAEDKAVYPDETHYHYSMTYLATLKDKNDRLIFDPVESTDIRWFSKEDIERGKEFEGERMSNIKRILLYAFEMSKKVNE
jgi:8-oxo-dGTP pyrophosphatase MutT (NUDIX family)